MIDKIEFRLREFIDENQKYEENETSFSHKGYTHFMVMGTASLMVQGLLWEDYDLDTFRDIDLAWQYDEGMTVFCPGEVLYVDIIRTKLACLVSDTFTDRVIPWFEYNDVKISLMTLEDIICTMISGYRLGKYKDRVSTLMSYDFLDKDLLLTYLREAISKDFGKMDKIREYWFKHSYNAFMDDFFPDEPHVELPEMEKEPVDKSDWVVLNGKRMPTETKERIEKAQTKPIRELEARLESEEGVVTFN